MGQYLYIPFLGEWTSINPSYFDVNRRGTIGFDTLPYSCTAVLYTYIVPPYPDYILTGVKVPLPMKVTQVPKYSKLSVASRETHYASSIRQHVLAVESLF